MGDLGKIARMSTLSEEEMAVVGEDTSEEISEDTGITVSDDSADDAAEQVEQVKEKKPALDFESGDYMEFDVTMTAPDMFRFMMRHAYFGISGVLGILVSIASIIILCTGAAQASTFSIVLLVVAALMFTVINPTNIYLRAKRQAKAAASDKAPYTYVIGDAGIKVSRLEESVPITWDNIIKVREGKTSIYMYLAVNRAFVLPKLCYEGQEDKLKGFIRNHVPAGKCRLK